MAHEPQPRSSESLNNPSFGQTIATQVAILGDQNHPQPNPSEKHFGISFEPDFDYGYGGNGSINFGSKWGVHRMFVGDSELIFAANSHGEDQSPQGKFYIHEFTEDGQITRTWFTETSDGEIWKQRQTAFGTGVGESFIELSHQLSKEEAGTLKAVVEDPTSHRAELAGLVALSDEETAAVIQATEENSRDVGRLKADLNSFAEARQLGWAAMLRDTTLY